jgi:ribonuclease HI
MSIIRAKPVSIETIGYLPRAPQWQSPLKTFIAGTKEEAIQQEEEDEADVKIFTDGSGHDGGIGAAAILFHGHRTSKVARYFLGTERQNTVFEGECVGQLLAMELLRRGTADLRHARVTIYVDNQASLGAHHKRKPGPGRYLIDEVHRRYEVVRGTHPGIQVELRWIPGHMDILGSELVDAEAKRAAEGQMDRRSHFGVLADSSSL